MLTFLCLARIISRVSDYQQRNQGFKPKYKDKKRPQGAAAPRVRTFKTADAPEGSENWVRPWVQLKYFTYNPAVFPRMLGAVSPDAVQGGLINVYDKNGDFKRAMNVQFTPQVYVVDKDGKIVYSHTGYTPGGEYELFEQIKKLQ